MNGAISTADADTGAKVHLPRRLFASSCLAAAIDSNAHTEPLPRSVLILNQTCTNSRWGIDSRPRIPGDAPDKVFEAFSTTRREGSVVELSIARTNIESYGGKVWTENHRSGWTVFRLTLPLTEVHAA